MIVFQARSLPSSNVPAMPTTGKNWKSLTAKRRPSYFNIERRGDVMTKIRIGCQTYTWQMSGKKYLDQLPHIIQIASQAGFVGLEPETQFLGELWHPERMSQTLQANKIELAALTLVEDWLHPEETEQERANAVKTMDF